MSAEYPLADDHGDRVILGIAGRDTDGFAEFTERFDIDPVDYFGDPLPKVIERHEMTHSPGDAAPSIELPFEEPADVTSWLDAHVNPQRTAVRLPFGGEVVAIPGDARETLERAFVEQARRYRAAHRAESILTVAVLLLVVSLLMVVASALDADKVGLLWSGAAAGVAMATGIICLKSYFRNQQQALTIPGSIWIGGSVDWDLYPARGPGLTVEDELWRTLTAAERDALCGLATEPADVRRAAVQTLLALRCDDVEAAIVKRDAERRRRDLDRTREVRRIVDRAFHSAEVAAPKPRRRGLAAVFGRS